MANELTNNPYVVGPPVTGKRLYGRQEVFQFVLESLAGATNRMIVLHGQRRIGKSSVLQELHLHRLLAEKYCAVRIDVQGQAQALFSEAIHDLAAHIAEALDMAEPNLADYEGNDNYFVQTFLPAMLNVLGDRRLVIMIDEFDALINDESGAGPTNPASAGMHFLPLLQTILSNHTFDKLIFILVIGRSLEKLPPAFSRLIRGARFNHIWLLSPNEAKTLITQPVAGLLTYDNQAIDKILDYTAGHPYFTQLLCYELFNLAKRERQHFIEAGDVEQVIETALETGGPAFVWLWDALSIAERLLVSAIGSVVAEAGTAHKEDIQQILNDHRVRLGNIDLIEAANHLVEERVLEFAGQDGYCFKVELVRQWVKHTHHLHQEKLKISDMSRTAISYYNLAKHSHERRKLEAAVEEYRLALQDNPNHFNAQLGLAQALQEQGKLEEAVKEFENAYWLNEEASLAGLVGARMALAEVLEEKEEYVEAAVHYRRVHQLAPQHRPLQEKLKIFYDKGQQASNRNNWAEATEFFERVVDIDSNYTDARSRLLGILYTQGREVEEAANWAKASHFFRRVTDIDPTYADAAQRQDAVESQMRTPVPPIPLPPPTRPKKLLKPMLGTTVAILVLLGSLGGWFIWGNSFLQTTPTSTQAIAIVDHTPTQQPTTQPTEEPTQEPTPTETPTLEVEVALTVELISTPALTPVPINTPTDTLTATPTPTPSLPSYPQPQLISPPNLDFNSAAGLFTGRTDQPRLQWEPVLELGPNDFYVVSVSYPKGADSAFGGVTTKNTFWDVDQRFYDEVTGLQRDFRWSVVVSHFEGTTINAQRTPEPVGEGVEVSPRSEEHIFRWDRDTELTPTPTNTLVPTAIPEPRPLPTGEALDIDINPQNPAELFALLKNGAIYKTQDSGKIWEEIRSSSPQASISVLTVAPNDPNIIYAGAFGQVMKSTDGGDNWQSFPLPGRVQINALAITNSNSNIIYTATSGGILISQDGGQTWANGKNVNGLDLLTPFYAITIAIGNDTPVYAAGEGDVIYLTNHPGANWQPIGCQGCARAFYALAVRGDTIFAGGADATLIRSDNRSNQWQSVNYGIPNSSIPTLDISTVILTSNSNILYAGTGFRANNDNGRGIARSTDGGNSWTHLPLPQETGKTYYVQNIAADPIDPDIIYIAGFGGVHKSEDGGQTWIKQ